MSEKSKHLFSFVVSFFSTWGWQALGKIPDPATGQEVKNLDQANRVIGILQMLREKTQGNLTEEESRLLASALADLQLNYVEEIVREKQKDTAKSQPEQREEKTDSDEQQKP
ncbi:MAG TPA: DUF1844 domain-containing protein [bacterium]|nr:DUF1844 domain-containing protein [bacterium]HPP11420.1 DUF1844 domain-containing protein [bacterium]